MILNCKIKDFFSYSVTISFQYLLVIKLKLFLFTPLLLAKKKLIKEQFYFCQLEVILLQLLKTRNALFFNIVAEAWPIVLSANQHLGFIDFNITCIKVVMILVGQLKTKNLWQVEQALVIYYVVEVFSTFLQFCSLNFLKSPLSINLAYKISQN